MPVYLSRYTGTGADTDPFRPEGATVGGWASIDLRPDPTSSTGWCILRTPTGVSTSNRVILLGELDDPLTGQQRATLANRLGVVLDSSKCATVRDAICHLLLDVGDDGDDTKWNRLRGDRIWLGECIWGDG